MKIIVDTIVEKLIKEIPEPYKIFYCPQCNKANGYLLAKKVFCKHCKYKTIEIKRK